MDEGGTLTGRPGTAGMAPSGLQPLAQPLLLEKADVRVLPGGVPAARSPGATEVAYAAMGVVIHPAGYGN
ncbi:hypothetical protein GCM10018773_63140 [Streptomyces candidus]|nr:hypothetical protein GCM10018773_63140 [Streptomyces candidus]